MTQAKNTEKLKSDIFMEALATTEALARRGINVDGSQWFGHGLGDDGQVCHGFMIGDTPRYFHLDGSEAQE